MSPLLPTVAGMSDEDLWRKARDGDREAFGQIVERHQSLICALAYSACGSLSRSEDLAQETFVTAWQRLAEVREPGKLRAWLCGIARHLAANANRREQRRGGPAQSLDDLDEPTAPDADPAARAVSREEEALLWRSLASLPETYREPMVLFYRQGQSVTEVARSLSLSDDAVKQRLSRGRALLKDELAALVETTLVRTRPGLAFTAGVMTVLTLATADAAKAALAAGAASAVGAAGTPGGALGKGLIAKLGAGLWMGPLIGLACAFLGTRAAASTARSARERCVVLQTAWLQIIPYCVLMSLGLAAVLGQAGKMYTASAAWIVFGVSVWTAALIGGILLLSQRLEQQVQRIRIETGTTEDSPAGYHSTCTLARRWPRRYVSRARFLGLPLFAMDWGGTPSGTPRKEAVYAWVAIGDIAISPCLAVGGVAIAPVAVGALTVGVASLSVFWGVAFGVVAVGSLGFGWWAIGCAAAGVRAAAGFAAVAKDYAFGVAASAAEPGTPAALGWLKAHAIEEILQAMAVGLPWAILGAALVLAAVRLCRRRARSL